jgi:hypothetical protein
MLISVRLGFGWMREWRSFWAAFGSSRWRDGTRRSRRLELREGALALAEPGTPGEANGQDLIHASDIVYYRTKATYVFWMLRDLVGDAQLAAALTAYRRG